MTKSKVPDPKQYKVLQPFAACGVEFTGWRGDEALADSPFDPSGTSDHFHVHVKKGTWHDKKTNGGGGLADFLAAVQADYQKVITPSLLAALAKDRKLPIAAFEPWALGWDANRKAYTLIVPGADGRACDIRRYSLRTHKMKSTWGCETGLLGSEQLRSAPPNVEVDITEGEWDTFALRYLHTLTGRAESRIVVAVPGATTFKTEWVPAFKGRRVAGWYDHGKAGEEGDAIATRRLRGRVASLRFVHWPSDRPDGYDLRDEITVALKAKKPRACWKRLRQWLRDEPRKTPDSVDTDTPSSDDSLDDLDREWIYAYGTKRLVYVGGDPNTRAFYELDKESFSDRYAHLFPNDKRTNAAARQMLERPCRKVAQPAYLPNQPQLTTERVRGTDLPVVNIWIPSDVVFRAGDIDRYHKHVAYVIPDTAARRTVYDWLSFLLRYPERKPNWAPAIGGKAGIGKDTIIWPIGRALGVSNFTTPGPNDFDSNYNDFLRHAKLVIVDAMRFKGKPDLMNRLKLWIASPPERIRINGKWLGQYDTANIFAFFFMMNARASWLQIDRDDRRFFVHWSRATPKPGQYYIRLWNWLREPGTVGAIGHYFVHEHSCSKSFDPLAPPPMTADKRDLMDASESTLMQVMRQALQDEEGPFARNLVTVREVRDWLVEHVSLKKLTITDRQIGDGLHDLEAVNLDAQIPVTFDGETNKRRLWALRDVRGYKDMNLKTLEQRYQEERRGRSPLTRIRDRTTPKTKFRLLKSGASSGDSPIRSGSPEPSE